MIAGRMLQSVIWLSCARDLPGRASKSGFCTRFQILAVFDENTVYISLFDEKIPARDSSDVIIKNKRFASFIISLFNIYWDKADTLEKLKKELNN